MIQLSLLLLLASTSKCGASADGAGSVVHVVSACEGDSITLDCRYSNTTDESHITVIWTWLTNTGNSYLVLKKRATTPREVGSEYKGRVDLVEGPGEASVKIVNVGLNDTRLYLCQVSDLSQGGFEKSKKLNLTVQAKGKCDDADKPNVGGIVAGTCGVVVCLAGVGFAGYKIKTKREGWR